MSSEPIEATPTAPSAEAPQMEVQAGEVQSSIVMHDITSEAEGARNDTVAVPESDGVALEDATTKDEGAKDEPSSIPELEKPVQDLTLDNSTEKAKHTEKKKPSKDGKKKKVKKSKKQGVCPGCKSTVKVDERLTHLCAHRDNRLHCSFCDAFFEESQRDSHLQDERHIKTASRPEGMVLRRSVRGFLSDAAYVELLNDPEINTPDTFSYMLADMHKVTLKEKGLPLYPSEEEDPEFWYWQKKHGSANCEPQTNQEEEGKVEEVEEVSEETATLSEERDLTSTLLALRERRPTSRTPSRSPCPGQSGMDSLHHQWWIKAERSGRPAMA